ncbi:MAG: helix-turn-helix transcriptional regulator [Acetobacteraceae bacterium]|nr:helix-turn-helix transcriptional regulator [Acetobacteraceae bacterium]MBV8521383.1 helix-turn-helix transcriptional regulator [Acetobacteraceae bacterium]
MAVGQRIAKLRTGRLTQEALANKTGLTRTSIINIEKGRQQILLHTLMDISRALQVPVGELIPELDNLDMMLRNKPRTLELDPGRCLEIAPLGGDHGRSTKANT